jgi:hypothetical protein
MPPGFRQHAYFYNFTFLVAHLPKIAIRTDVAFVLCQEHRTDTRMLVFNFLSNALHRLWTSSNFGGKKV